MTNKLISFYSRLKGLLCEGSVESPILHLRLVEPYETIEEDEGKLKEVVAIVSWVYFFLMPIKPFFGK